MATRNPRRPSHMRHNFGYSPVPKIQRSTFDRSHTHKTTFDSGLLIPIFHDEVMAGDTVKFRMSALIRLATPIHPIMDNMQCKVECWFVPYRQVWPNIVKMYGEQDQPGDSTDFLVPQVQLGPEGEQSLFDYMGIPLQTGSINVSALPFRCFNHIYNEGYRDQNLQQPAVVQKDDGPDVRANYPSRKRAKGYDYFTGCLPWAQKTEAVELPLGDLAPIIGIGMLTTGSFVAGDVNVNETKTPNVTYPSSISTSVAARMSVRGTGSTPEIYADLSEATASPVNLVRTAFQVQRIFERDARGGTRFPEILRSHFGVLDPQMLVLQRPEYLGGGSFPIQISPVPQTNATAGATTPQGNLAAVGTGIGNAIGFTRSFTEPGHIFCIISAVADLTYQQGLERMWSRRSRFDFFWPSLAHIGEQPVLSKEIFADGSENDDDVFGYQEAWADYRYKNSRISGKFRSKATGTLDAWHLAQEFSARPVLNSGFIEENVPVARVVAVQSEPQFLCDAYFNYIHTRPMPVRSIPGFIDHF